jgi:hypothetical protein
MRESWPATVRAETLSEFSGGTVANYYLAFVLNGNHESRHHAQNSEQRRQSSIDEMNTVRRGQTVFLGASLNQRKRNKE